jgi:hypothetical protein
MTQRSPITLHMYQRDIHRQLRHNAINSHLQISILLLKIGEMSQRDHGDEVTLLVWCFKIKKNKKIKKYPSFRIPKNV